MKRLALLAVLLVACGGSDTPDEDGPLPTTYGGDRPTKLHAPGTLTPGKQYPLLVILHGYSANGLVQNAYFNGNKLVDNDEALVLSPDGTISTTTGNRFWNADPQCCDFDNQMPDDVGYLGGMIEDVSADWPVDPARVFVLGHSNGGYMAYRLACERSDLVRAIGVLAGAAATNPAMCNPTQPVSVLHLHGTVDEAVPYASAAGSVEQWATHDTCSSTARTASVTHDLDDAVVGAETHGETTTGCASPVAVDLWTMEGSTHVPSLAPTAIDTIMAWLVAHART